MPFKGLTWFRLKEHIRKTFWIYAVGIVVMLFVSNLLYTVTTPRTPAEKEVLVYLVDAYTNTEGHLVEELAADGLEHGRQSDETLELVRFESIPYQGTEDYTSPILLTARMSIGDGDVYLCAPEGFDYATKAGLPIDLAPYLAEGWLSGLNAETYSYTDPETGETIVAGVSLANVHALDDMFMFDNDEAYLLIASNSSNVETSMDVVEHMLYALMDMESTLPIAETTEVTTDASADSEEPEA